MLPVLLVLLLLPCVDGQGHEPVPITRFLRAAHTHTHTPRKADW